MERADKMWLMKFSFSRTLINLNSGNYNWLNKNKKFRFHANYVTRVWGEGRKPMEKLDS